MLRAEYASQMAGLFHLNEKKIKPAGFPETAGFEGSGLIMDIITFTKVNFVKVILFYAVFTILPTGVKERIPLVAVAREKFPW